MEAHDTRNGARMRSVVDRLRSPRVLLSVAATIAVLTGVIVVMSAGGGDEELTLVPRGDSEEVLPPSDPAGSPHFVLTDDFDPAVNTSRKVPDFLSSDPDGLLDVEESVMSDGTGPYDIVWRIARGGGQVDCVNCAMLDARLKSIIASVLESPAGEGVESVIGVDTARTLAGDYAGNGWQAEFVVGDGAEGVASGEKVASWLLANSAEGRILSVTWQNLLRAASKCGTDLSAVAPVEAYNSDPGSSAAARRDAALDRVVVASPAYSPVFEDRDGAVVLQGWRATSC